MPKTIESQSSRNQKKLLGQLLIPSLPQISLDVSLGGMLLALLNIQALWHYFDDTLLVAGQQASTSRSGGLLNHLWMDVSQSRIPQVIFWMFLGCGVYVIIWFVRSVIINIRNDVTASQFVRPKSYSVKTYWESILTPKVFLACSVVVLAGCIYTAFRLLPTLAKICATAVRPFQPTHSLIQLALALIAATVLIQVFWILGLITSRSWWSVNNEL